jgi:O-succinylbenzoic acid--CoA ligase
MEQTSQREVRLVDPAWSLSELMARIAKALVADGPALALSPTSRESVPSRIALIVTTTGSSGVAKEVGLSASSLLSSAKASNKFLNAEFGSTWSLLLPLNHIAGINVLIRSLELGTTPINLIGQSGPYPDVDFTAIVPTQLFRALNGDAHLLRHLQSAQAVLVGGAALTHQLRKSAEDAGIVIVETYGSTETSGGCIYNGQALDGVEYRVGDDKKISITGDTLAHSYLNADLSLIDHEGWYHTSDAGRIEDGQLIVEGRIDDVFVSGGVNVSLSSIERVISQNYPHLTFAAFTAENPEWGTSLHIALVGADSGLDGAIQNLLESELGAAAKAKSFLHLTELPLVGIGKVDRTALQELLRGKAD